MFAALQFDTSTVIGIIGICLTVFAIIATLIAGSYRWTHRGEKKALSYDFASARLTTVKYDFSGRLEVTFDKRPVSDVSILIIRVWNSGRMPILRDDFASDLNLRVEGTVLTAEVASREPNDLDIPGVQGRIESGADDLPTPHIRSEINIHPLLLNPSDEFTIFALASGFQGTLEARARIAGVKRIERKARADVERGIVAKLILTAAGTTVTVLLALYVYSSFGDLGERLAGLAYVLSLAVGAGAFSQWYFRRTHR